MNAPEEAKIVYDDFKPQPRSDGRINLNNPHLAKLKHDTLYHLALDTQTHDFPAMFGDVKFVCMGGTAHRMKEFAELVGRLLEHDKCGSAKPLKDLTEASHRFSMFKVGPVLSISHGMGCPSFSILLHEVFKLVKYADCTNVTFFRIGTSGGIGVKPGTVVITNQAVDELIRPFHELHILDKIVRRPTTFDESLIQELKRMAEQENHPYQTILGKTMCASDFYEAQSRLDGAFCGITQQQKENRLKQLNQAGVVNIEMEATVFSSMCRYAGVPGAIVCVTLVNRLEGDQINERKEVYEEYQRRPLQLVLNFIKQRLAQNSNHVNGTNGTH